nr:hypothetical protein [uncultured Flavobacterium sp.]
MPRNELIYEPWCNERGILIYPVPITATANGVYHICIEVAGKVTKGQFTYRDKPMKGEPSVWDKIRQLYKETYEKNFKPLTNEYNNK